MGPSAEPTFLKGETSVQILSSVMFVATKKTPALGVVLFNVPWSSRVEFAVLSNTHWSNLKDATMTVKYTMVSFPKWIEMAD